MQCNRQVEQEFEALGNLVLGNAVSSSAHKGGKRKKERSKLSACFLFTLIKAARSPTSKTRQLNYACVTHTQSPNTCRRWVPLRRTDTITEVVADRAAKCRKLEQRRLVSVAFAVRFSALGPISLKPAVAGRTKM